MPSVHRRLLLAEKPLFFWTVRVGSAAWRGILGNLKHVRELFIFEYHGAKEEGPWVIALGWPIAVLVYLGAIVFAGVWFLALLAFSFAFFAVWIAMLPAALVLSLPGGAIAAGAAAYLRYRRHCGVTLRCKYGRCTFRDVQLAYRCPRCGTAYRELLPSHFGILSHTCTCGARLPTLASRGRERLTKVCPRCQSAWVHGDQPLQERFVALVGGPCVGKTCYLTMITERLCSGNVSPSLGRVCFESPADKDEHEHRLALLKSGRLLPETQPGVPDALVLRVRRADRPDFRLYLYDAWGQEYVQMERSFGEMCFFQDLSGILFLIDPLALRHGPALTQLDDGSGALAAPLDKIVAVLRRNVRRFLRYGYSGQTNIPLAVVVNKADVAGVAARLGTGAVGDPSRLHRACRNALFQWGAGPELLALEADFPRIRYFSCSALGRTPDGSHRPFEPREVLPPLIWLLDNSCSDNSAQPTNPWRL